MMFILVMILGGVGGNALATATFDSEQSCIEAIVKVKENVNIGTYGSYICVKK